ncbi:MULTISPECIES: type II toxin-antitoxin system RelE/ParE family toxin [Marinomonas]|uniref:Type II toxin-antitoxin system RelE/ParE family toxin n=1 Tax=Marinomonas arctica TaxID=383750 RepID=A0A7H1J9Q9_9GAMM|nr:MULTISPECIES: type II toxin-antitoxin system RelE/ParE family toxin [Marinomonas]QNT07225.1 type II toxin-antitoxin system RelE/ParE family toxin [Marinomonas arctica]GGN24712.1 toxin ParE1 [Marinomonas arctica]
MSDIFDYSDTEFRLDQVVRYLKDLEHCFIQLCDNPSIGRERTEIRAEFYSFVSQSHVVFYRVMTNRLRIVRVLHGSRDLPRHF